jgi:hypothetical protein
MEPAGAAFPLPLSAYAPGEEGMGLADVLLHRIRVEPMNLVATAIFLAAIVHTFLAPALLAASNRMRRRREAERGAEGHSFAVEVLHFLGEIEAVFGIWCIPLLAAIAATKGPRAPETFLREVHFTEPLFVFVIMSMASTRPVLAFAEGLLARLAALGGGRPLAWWLSILTVGPLLGSFITEPAAMIICALLLSRRVLDLGVSTRLRYATLGLLFVNVSVGGTLTHFAAPPVLIVAERYGWNLSYMASHLGWKAVIGIVIANAGFALALRRELAALAAVPEAIAPARRPIPPVVVAVHLGFLALTVAGAHTPALFLGGFLFFLAFHAATAPYQDPIDLRSPLLVGFFLAGLVVHGTLQGWWIAPVLGSLSELPLFLGAVVLTSFNDNAAITYLASLVPQFGDAARYAVVAGAVTGGGLTVIANAPNPAGQAALAKHFPDGVSPLRLLAGAAIPTVVMALCFLVL